MRVCDASCSVCALLFLGVPRTPSRSSFDRPQTDTQRTSRGVVSLALLVGREYPACLLAPPQPRHFPPWVCVCVCGWVCGCVWRRTGGGRGGVGSYPSRPPTPSPPPKESGVSGSCVDGLGCARGERLGTRTQCGVVWDRTDEDVWRAYWVEERGWGCGLEGRAGRAGKWVWVGSWGSRVNDVGRRYPTFRAALRAWAFRDRRSSGRWRRLCVCVCE